MNGQTYPGIAAREGDAPVRPLIIRQSSFGNHHSAIIIRQSTIIIRQSTIIIRQSAIINHL